MTTKTFAQTPKMLAAEWERHRIAKIPASNIRHEDLKKYLGEMKKLGLKVDEVGRSYGNREIYQVQWGKGATRVFMWSQMHGDEPTATPALLDMFAFLQKNRHKDWVKQMENTLTIRGVPMLNPDGAELFQRRNLQAIDINRDARNLQTPEGQLLMRLRDEWSPHVGFNLHNQNALTSVSGTFNQAAISFLVVRGNPEIKDFEEGHERNKRLASAMLTALQNFIPGHIGRYVDGYTPAAFGDTFSDLGTPAILIETGELYGRDEFFLAKLNFVAFLTALKSLADGTEKMFSPMNYEMLPNNSSGRLNNFIFRRANIINPENPEEISAADIAVNTERRRAGFSRPAFVRAVGDLFNARGLQEYNMSEFYIVPRIDTLRVGSRGEFLFYRKSRVVDWKSSNLEKEFPPDAIFSLGQWIKGAELMKDTRQRAVLPSK